MIYYVITLLSQIYCQGPLLEAVQNAYIFNDSKTFVDMPLKYDPVTTLRDFYALGSRIKKREVLVKFVNDYFHPPGRELIECYPEDWEPHPKNFYKIKDYHFRRWALALNRMWRDLCRQVRKEVQVHQDMFSLLYVPHPFIIPGGRFREFYYWDSFWIMKGLLFSEMYYTARGIIRNLAILVDNHGFVPNGGRVYYLYRSQPPLLIPMVYEYYLNTGDIEFVQELLPMLEKEYTFWLHERAFRYEPPSTSNDSSTPKPSGVNGTRNKFPAPKTHFNYFQYRAIMKSPRPESFREDLELVRNLSAPADRELMWSNIASAAETGWDFSTRWFAQSGPDAGDMSSIRTWSIVPVDLNAFMCMNTRILKSFYEITGNMSKVLDYQRKYEQAKKEMYTMHWNEEDGIWYDYDLEERKHVRTYYISNALPLYAKCYDDETVPHRVHDYMKHRGLFNFTKGLPTSLNYGSQQQWDSSNAWPPMIHMVIEGFRTSGVSELMTVAEGLATQWLKANYKGWINTHNMFEKYNVSSEEGHAGSGGEYEVQTGFGWTNGVILDLLNSYGEVLSSTRGSILPGYFEIFILGAAFLLSLIGWYS